MMPVHGGFHELRAVLFAVYSNEVHSSGFTARGGARRGH